MKVKELIERLHKVDPEMMVYVPSKHTEYDYCAAKCAACLSLSIEDSEDYPDQTITFVIDEL